MKIVIPNPYTTKPAKYLLADIFSLFFVIRKDYRAKRMPRMVSSSPPPNAAIPGRFKIPASGSIAPVGAAVAPAVAAAWPDEDELLEPPELPPLELLLELELDELLELLDDELELDDEELDDELDELLELLDDELELDDEELELDELAPATVKATLQFPPPSHSSARGLLIGAVGTCAFCSWIVMNIAAAPNRSTMAIKTMASIFFFLSFIYLNIPAMVAVLTLLLGEPRSHTPQ